MLSYSILYDAIRDGIIHVNNIIVVWGLKSRSYCLIARNLKYLKRFNLNLRQKWINISNPLKKVIIRKILFLQDYMVLELE